MDLPNTGREQTAPGPDRAPSKLAERLSLAAFCLAIVVLGMLYGMIASWKWLFPYPQLRGAIASVAALKTEVLERHETIALPDSPEYRVAPDAPPAADGLLLVAGMGADLVNFVRVIDRSGKVVHEWRPNWFEIWPDDGYLPPDRRPKSPPGELVHGAAITPEGDLVFNFERLSTVRLDACGSVRWRLPNFGHHSVFIADEGDIWVAAERDVKGAPGAADNARSKLRTDTIQKLSPEGEVLLELPVIDILAQNGLDGLLHMSTTENRATPISGDILHLNDVEIFPRTLAPGFFTPGDILVSLRNINTVLVLDPTGSKVKFAHTGELLRQHDPDFTSGDTITVFDNHNTEGSVLSDGPPKSRILEITAPSGAVREIFRDGPAYFTNIMGEHRVLPNGDLLVTATFQGQALEIAPDGRIAWQFENDLGDGMRGVVTRADLLPPEMNAAFFEALQAKCQGEG